MRMWAAFAKTGNPSVKGLIEWPAYTEQTDQFLYIGQKLEVKKGVKSSYEAPPSR
jgi:para-nitrobenzyl esterase